MTLAMALGSSVANCCAVSVPWIPLREPFGIGTILNAILIGVFIDVTISVVPAPESTAGRWTLLLAGIIAIGFATGLYIGANLGPGPRDGLMTGIAKRGPSIRLVRSVLEVTVLATGFALGGTLGIGTIIFALTIGPLVHYFLPTLRFVAIPPPTNNPGREAA